MDFTERLEKAFFLSCKLTAIWVATYWAIMLSFIGIQAAGWSEPAVWFSVAQQFSLPMILWVIFLSTYVPYRCFFMGYRYIQMVCPSCEDAFQFDACPNCKGSRFLDNACMNCGKAFLGEIESCPSCGTHHLKTKTTNFGLDLEPENLETEKNH